METTVLALTLCLVIPSFATESIQSIPLSMMENSIDDMYDGCKESMAEVVKNVYFPRENNIDPFKNAWKVAGPFAKEKYEKRPDKSLTLEQVQAVYVYSQEFPNVYGLLNAMLRAGKAKYASRDFPYHALHFWITSALQVINADNNKPCQTTYRRTNNKYTGEVNQQMRFGYFASSSTDPDQITFGRETCFYTETCFGANIKSYSRLDEDEVLIPPYETFKITEIAEGSYKEMKDCKKVFVLKSTGKLSNLNCKATKPKLTSTSLKY
ncbi:erythroblast NAD(P)(+)--arginine ADP-ribosyltransferase-like [Boleophthalmus pectinirostris]|uniref:erythroblast NAD(P)(+)--arginine ADP-ribosyltransferase-like n=1 Tax=Boleophthalmus pectinirostris TaxID=150288 RepID=UPI00242BE999|nr:erythroblast NAD(P)(+)--arginine ADP-ribosyltransferase-like [Boleophthalmus pectinirostris]